MRFAMFDAVPPSVLGICNPTSESTSGLNKLGDKFQMTNSPLEKQTVIYPVEAGSTMLYILCGQLLKIRSITTWRVAMKAATN